MKRKSKKEMVLDIYDREAMGEVTAREIAIINQALVEEYGEGGAMAPAEIARILTDEELPVRFEQIFRMMTPAEKYENLFAPLADNASLEQAEKALSRIDDLYRRFLREKNKTGVRFAFQTARLARKNAEEAASSPLLSPLQRREMSEVAQWFTIWLQTPDLLRQWLELRKATKEYNDLFGGKEKAEPGPSGTN